MQDSTLSRRIPVCHEKLQKGIYSFPSESFISGIFNIPFPCPFFFVLTILGARGSVDLKFLHFFVNCEGFILGIISKIIFSLKRFILSDIVCCL